MSHAPPPAHRAAAHHTSARCAPSGGFGRPQVFVTSWWQLATLRVLMGMTFGLPSVFFMTAVLLAACSLLANRARAASAKQAPQPA